MEDLKAYIESGILELYVLGDITPEEKLQVEAVALKHPAIKAELDEIERSMENYAAENAIEPPEHLRNRILNSLVVNLGDDNTFNKAKPVEPINNVVQLQPKATTNFYKYAFAACLALLLASAIALLNVYHKLQDSTTQLAALQLDKQQFANTVSLKDGELEVLQDKSFKFLKLQGTAKAPGSQVTVAWSPVKKKVWIDMASLKIPENDKAHKYQLWALIGGKPVDLGVFDKASDTTDMKEMKSTAYADAFAVTREPYGGSAKPTLDQMMALGKF